MPIYAYECPRGHRTEHFRKMGDRRKLTICECGKRMRLAVSAPHIVPDGVYSYAPNIGSEEAFERRRAAIRERQQGGRGVIEKQDQPKPRD